MNTVGDVGMAPSLENPVGDVGVVPLLESIGDVVDSRSPRDLRGARGTAIRYLNGAYLGGLDPACNGNGAAR